MPVHREAHYEIVRIERSYFRAFSCSTLTRTFWYCVTLYTVWLGNRVEDMKFSEGLQTKTSLIVMHIYDSDLVASSTDKLSVGTDLMHQSHMLHTYINCIIIPVM